MKMRYAVIFFIVAFILQGSLINLIAFKGVAPNLILCLVVTFAFMYEDFNGTILAVVFGLLSDILYGLYVGPGAIAYFSVSLVSIAMRENINKENKGSMIFASIGSTVLFNLIYFLIYKMTGNIYSFKHWLFMQPMHIAFNLAVAIVLYAIFIKRVVKYRNDRYLLWKKF